MIRDSSILYLVRRRPVQYVGRVADRDGQIASGLDVNVVYPDAVVADDLQIVLQ